MKLKPFDTVDLTVKEDNTVLWEHRVYYQRFTVDNLLIEIYSPAQGRIFFKGSLATLISRLEALENGDK